MNRTLLWICLGAVATVAVAAALTILRAPAKPAHSTRPAYSSCCVLKASRPGVAELLAPDATATHRMAVEVATEELLRFDRVMTALADTELVRDIEKQAKGDPDLRRQVEEQLYTKIVDNTRVEPRGDFLISVTYSDDNPDRAVLVLTRLVTHFVENALAKERDDARRARDLAAAELTRAKDGLEAAETRLAAFRETHPRAGDPDAGKELRDLVNRLGDIDTQLTAKRRQVERLTAQIEKAASPLREALALKKSDTEAELDQLTELRKDLLLQRTRLEEEGRALPGLEHELARLLREKRRAEEQYDTASKNFERIDRQFALKMEGLVTFSIVSPPRTPPVRKSRPSSSR